MIVLKHLDHLVLTVKSIPQTVSFYTTALGMEKEIFKGHRVALKYGEYKINLHEKGKEFEPKAFNVQEGSADLCFVTQTSLKQCLEHLKNLNIPVEEGPIERTGAMGKIESIYIRDPDKNLIELCNYYE